MKSPTKYDCEVCENKGYVIVKCLVQDYKRKCLCCDGGKKDESFRKMSSMSGNRKST